MSTVTKVYNYHKLKIKKLTMIFSYVKVLLISLYLEIIINCLKMKL